jgi:2-hydroxy-3-keto-5-methylthiopentenyl-1-phosphate phosphatase
MVNARTYFIIPRHGCGLDTMDVAVVVDFDGTVTQKAVTYMLMERYGSPGWRDLDKEYTEGRLTAKEVIGRMFASIEATDEQIADFARQHVQLRPGFLEFISHLRGLGYPVAITSEGLDLYIDPVLDENGVDYVNLFYNEASRDAEGRLFAKYPHSSFDCEDCGNCKAGLVKALQADGNYVVFIGNGWTDVCPAREANIVFARDMLARTLEEEGRPFILFEDFHDILEAWDSVVAHG